MRANSKEGILYFKSYYEKHGYKITLCEICHKIKSIEYPKICVSGPSISSGMDCDGMCERKFWSGLSKVVTTA